MGLMVLGPQAATDLYLHRLPALKGPRGAVVPYVGLAGQSSGNYAFGCCVVPVGREAAVPAP
jgi:hypothetical protein